MKDRTDQVLQILVDLVAVLKTALERPETPLPVPHIARVEKAKVEPEEPIDVAVPSVDVEPKAKPRYRRTTARSVPSTTALQFLMDKSGLPTDDVATDLGISMSSLRAYLLGEAACVSPEIRSSIADLFSVPPEAIWDDNQRAKLLTPVIDNGPSLPAIKKMSLEEFAKKVGEGAYTEAHSYGRQLKLHKEQKPNAKGTSIPRPLSAGRGQTTVLSLTRSRKSLSLRYFSGLVKSQTNIPAYSYGNVERGEDRVESREARKIIASMLDVEDERTLFSTDGRAIKCPMP